MLYLQWTENVGFIQILALHGWNVLVPYMLSCTHIKLLKSRFKCWSDLKLCRGLCYIGLVCATWLMPSQPHWTFCAFCPSSSLTSSVPCKHSPFPPLYQSHKHETIILLHSLHSSEPPLQKCILPQHSYYSCMDFVLPPRFCSWMHWWQFLFPKELHQDQANTWTINELWVDLPMMLN